MRHVEAQMAFGPRPTGSEASRRTTDYILARLTDAGWDTETRPFVYREVEGRNLLGRGGAGEHVFLLGAHYDTRRRADHDPDTPDQPVPGANDGASGVAVLLELARVLDLAAVDGEVWLAFFDAEDNGRLDGWDWIVGSRDFAARLEVTPEYVIVVDMIGDADQDIYLEGNSDPVLQAHLWAIAADLGYLDYFIPEVRHSMLDDHTPFLEKGIPAVDIIDFDYAFWHTTQDTTDKVSPASLERVGRVLETFLEAGGAYPGPEDS
jgi:glutaminyl-peptide cyclotransferase